MAKLIEPDTTANRARIGAILDRYPAVGRYCANVIPDPRCAHVPFVNWPTVVLRRGMVELSWCNLTASFVIMDDEGGTQLVAETHDWTDVDPAGRLMACC